MAVVCTNCESDDLELVANLEDGRKRLRCCSCGQEWVRGEAKPVRRPLDTVAALRQRFPSPEDAHPDVLARAERLKGAFLQSKPRSRPEVGAYWARYQQVFSEEGLRTADPQDLKDFANSNIGANPGNMSVFNTAWNEMGPELAAERVRESVGYLLYGPETTPLEDRLTHLIDGHRGLGMTGFKEALLTKVLCVVQPERFIPIVKYTGQAGKKEIAKLVYDLDLYDPERVSWTIGRLILWSNDLLHHLVGEGFQDMQHAAEFLWWAKDQELASTRGQASVSSAGTDGSS